MKAFRSPVHNARMSNLDTSKAEAMKGVHVITWEDVPLLEYGHLSALGIPADEPLLAKDEVRYLGQPIAIVAAPSRGGGDGGRRGDHGRLRRAARRSSTSARRSTPTLPQIHAEGNWYTHFEDEMDRRQIRKGNIEEAFDKADLIVQGVYRPAAIEHAPIETQVCQVVPGGERAAHDLLLHAGALLLDGRRRGAPAGAAEQAQGRRRHGRRRLRRQGRHGHRDDVRAARAEVGQAGEVALDARGGVPLLVDPGAVAHGDRGRGDEGRLDPRPQDADAARRGRVLALLAVRPHEAQLPPHGRVLDPEPRVRRVRRLHEPHPDDRDARLRRHLGLVRDRDAPEPDRARARDRPVRAAAQEREPDRRHLAEPDRVHRPVDGADDPGDRRRDRPRPDAGVQGDDPAISGPATSSRSTSSANSETRRPTDGSQDRPRLRGDRVPHGDEPERRPVAGLDQGQARRPRSTSSPAPPTSATARRRSSRRSSPRRSACPYEWITYDNSNTDSSPVCTGTFASRATFVAGKAAEKAAENVRQKILEIAGKELEIDPADLEIVDGEVIAKGAPQKKISVPDVAAAATWTYGELITGTGAQLKPFATIVEPDDGQGRPSAPLGDLVRLVRGRGRGRRRDGRRHGDAAVAVLRRRQVDQPDARRGPDRGRRDAGARPRRPRELLPVLPLGRAPRRAVRVVPRAGHGRPAADRHDHHREPVHRRPVRRQGNRRDGEQRPAAGDRDGRVRRGRRLGDRAPDHARAGAAGAAGEGGGRAVSRSATARRWSSTPSCRSTRSAPGSRSGPPPDGGLAASARSTVWSPSPSFPGWGSTRLPATRSSSAASPTRPGRR